MDGSSLPTLLPAGGSFGNRAWLEVCSKRFCARTLFRNGPCGDVPGFFPTPPPIYFRGTGGGVLFRAALLFGARARGGARPREFASLAMKGRAAAPSFAAILLRGHPDMRRAGRRSPLAPSSEKIPISIAFLRRFAIDIFQTGIMPR